MDEIPVCSSLAKIKVCPPYLPCASLL